MKSVVKYIFAPVCAAVFCVSCQNSAEKKPETKEEAVPLVGLQTAVSETVSDDMVYSSTVQASAKNNIVPQQGGRIEKLLVEIGDYVKAGQVVAYMEDVQLQQSGLQVKNDEIELARLKSLYEKGGISQSDFEAFEMACKVHKSTYENLLRNTVLSSPVTGVISARNYDQGDMCGVSLPLYTVEQIVPVKLLVAISESDYTRIYKGAKASITVDAFPGKTFEGTVSNIYPTVDMATHTFTAEVKVNNADRKLRPGMYAKVVLTYGKTSRIVIPDAAVSKQVGSGDRFVYIYNEADGTVRYSKVELGRRLGNRYVVLSGVDEGDKVVTDGILRLKNGVKVNVAEQ